MCTDSRFPLVKAKPAYSDNLHVLPNTPRLPMLMDHSLLDRNTFYFNDKPIDFLKRCGYV